MLPTALAVAFVALPLGPDPTPERVRAAVRTALPLLGKAATGHADQKTCFACHNQAFPMMAFATARANGYALDPDLIPKQAEHVRDFLARNRDPFEAGKGTGGQVDTAGWALYTLFQAAGDRDPATTAVVTYLLKREPERAYWRTTSDRPPSESSSFVATYLAVRGVQAWATADQKPAAAKRVAAARGWLLKTPAKDTEDRVYRLRGLWAVEAPADVLAAAAKELRAGQRADGGWGQLDSMPSDAYATGTALAALHATGTLAASDPAFRRGLSYLLRTQRADGSWYVKSRSKPFQPYYESGFPYKKDQFIAATATAWATAALAAAVPEDGR